MIPSIILKINTSTTYLRAYHSISRFHCW